MNLKVEKNLKLMSLKYNETKYYFNVLENCVQFFFKFLVILMYIKKKTITNILSIILMNTIRTKSVKYF